MSDGGNRIITDAEFVHLAAAEFSVRVGLVRREDVIPFSDLAPIKKALCDAIAVAMQRRELERVLSEVYQAAQWADEQNVSALGTMRQVGEKLLKALPPGR